MIGTPLTNRCPDCFIFVTKCHGVRQRMHLARNVLTEYQNSNYNNQLKYI